MRLAAVLSLALALSASRAASGQSVLEARVFTDFGYLQSERDVPTGFSSGQLAGHLAATLSERFAFFGEVSATASDARFNVEVERAILRYDHADWLRLSGGRFHTPVSYWNTAFHHGQWLQTTVARPQMIRFGGSFLPVHFVGVMAEGRAAPGPLMLGYSLGMGNGRQENPARAGDAGDVNKSRALTAGASLSAPGHAALRLGGSFYSDRVPLPDAGTEVDERILSAYLVREREDPEVIAEYARIRHAPHGASGADVSSEAYYGQLAYRLPGAAHSLKPYLRAERLRPGGGDLLFGPLELGYEGVLGGVRWDVGPLAALKLEYRSERFEGEDWSGSIAAQLSFTFSVRSEASNPPPPPPPPATADGDHDDA
jgi:hypothetical protein